MRGRRKEILRRVSLGLLDRRHDRQEEAPRLLPRCVFDLARYSHRNGIVQEALLDERARNRGIFMPGAVEGLIVPITGYGSAGPAATGSATAGAVAPLFHRCGWGGAAFDARGQLI